jgi:hypothetical protein
LYPGFVVVNHGVMLVDWGCGVNGRYRKSVVLYPPCLVLYLPVWTTTREGDHEGGRPRGSANRNLH